MIGSWLKRLLGWPRPPAYEEARDLAAHEDWAVRARLAAQPGLRPEILYYLAEDVNTEVRRTVAGNVDTPPQAQLLLAADDDDQVRVILAGKIAKLAPTLDAQQQDRLRRATFEALELLARDRIVQVREILANALKDVAHAPPEVINRLARDAELAVAQPVLQFSPVLTDDDLLEIIVGGPVTGALAAISSRSRVGGRVADAVAATDDVDAIAVLLGNPSAQIREETLDRLVDRATDIEEWHQPLCHRPHLSANTAAKLSRFVASNLLRALSERRDLDPATARAVADAVARRLAEVEGGKGAGDTEPESEAALVERLRKMASAGELTEEMLTAAATGGDHTFVICGVAVLGAVPVAVVRKAIDTQSAKGIVALTWQAGLSATFSDMMQARLVRMPSPRILRAEGGRFPLDVSEMRWQLDFLAG